SLIAPATRHDFAANRLVLIVPVGSPLQLSGVMDLQSPAVKRIAVGNPSSVPVARYAREALKTAGILQELQQKYILTEHVRQSLDYVVRGKADAGFVYSTDAAIMRDKVKIVATVPTTTPIRYPIGIVKDSRQRSLAEAFVGLLA